MEVVIAAVVEEEAEDMQYQSHKRFTCIDR
jgi:hypothetical protein